MDWRKSTRSMNNGNCVEVASGVLIRDTQNPEVVLEFSPEAWQDFISVVR